MKRTTAMASTFVGLLISAGVGVAWANRAVVLGADRVSRFVAPKLHYRFPLRLCWEPIVASGSIGRFEGHLVPRTPAELLEGLRVSSSVTARVRMRVDRAIHELRQLKSTASVDGVTWDQIAHSGEPNFAIGERLHGFRSQLIPGSEETFDSRQDRIAKELLSDLNTELRVIGVAPLGDVFLYPLLHEADESHWFHWHRSR